MILNLFIIQIIFFQFYLYTLNVQKIKNEWKNFTKTYMSRSGIITLEIYFFLMMSSTLLIYIINWEKTHVTKFKKELIQK